MPCSRVRIRFCKLLQFLYSDLVERVLIKKMLHQGVNMTLHATGYQFEKIRLNISSTMFLMMVSVNWASAWGRVRLAEKSKLRETSASKLLVGSKLFFKLR